MKNNDRFARIYVEMKNFGQTPARQIHSWLTYEIAAAPPAMMLTGQRVAKPVSRRPRARSKT